MAFRGDFQPTERAYVHRLQVQPSDIDELGHANNVSWLHWVNEAALAHSESLGFGPTGLVALSVLWIVRRHDIEYLLPAFAGDQLEAVTWAHTLRGASSVRHTLIKREGRVAARAETTWVTIDSKTHKPVRVPQQLLSAYGF
jgi:acyl-CoA thioester hydrolase